MGICKISFFWGKEKQTKVEIYLAPGDFSETGFSQVNAQPPAPAGPGTAPSCVTPGVRDPRDREQWLRGQSRGMWRLPAMPGRAGRGAGLCPGRGLCRGQGAVCARGAVPCPGGCALPAHTRAGGRPRPRPCPAPPPPRPRPARSHRSPPPPLPRPPSVPRSGAPGGGQSAAGQPSGAERSRAPPPRAQPPAHVPRAVVLTSRTKGGPRGDGPRLAAPPMHRAQPPAAARPRAMRAA